MYQTSPHPRLIKRTAVKSKLWCRGRDTYNGSIYLITMYISNLITEYTPDIYPKWPDAWYAPQL